MANRAGIHQARSEARRKTLQMLYQSQISGLPTADILTRQLYVTELGLPCDFTRRLLEGISEHQDTIDALIASTSEHWAIERMPLVDLNILRLAVFEMLYLDEVPQGVAINEAVELAKRFGGEDDSSRFVNGVLGRIALQIESPPAQPPVESAGEQVAAGEQPAAGQHPPATDEQPAASEQPLTANQSTANKEIIHG